ncbi:MAG: alpha-amylase family glycosyl hydrolase [Bacteroidota bacterium]
MLKISPFSNLIYKNRKFAVYLTTAMRNYLCAFIILLLSISCRKADTTAAASVSAIICSSTVVSGAASVGIAYTGTLIIPYSGGNGVDYSSGTPIESTGITGLNATLQGGTLARGEGVFTFAVSGTPNGSGKAVFAVSFGGANCTVEVTVNETQPVQYGIPFPNVPDATDAVIYQVNMRCFSSTRNFSGVIARLDSIRNLGVNVIYLLPVYPIGSLKAVNSPYCVKDYMAVNPEFGTLGNLQALIEGAHSRGMAVVMDWVANHTSWDNAWISSHKDWYQQDGLGNIVSPSAGWTDVAQLNFNNQEMRTAMIRAMKYWVYTANCDGFRCDYADGPPADFWKQAIDSLRDITTHKLLMLAEGIRSNHFASGFNYIFGFRFYDQLKSIYSNNASVTGFDNVLAAEYNGAGESNRIVHYITNHDVNSSGTPLGWFGGKTGSMAAFVAVAYMKGVPMIYNGQEVGYPDPLYFMSTNSLIDWNLNSAMVAEYKRIIAFYNSSAAIRRGTLTTYTSTDVCAFTRTSGAETVFVASNLRNISVIYTLPAAVANANWTNALTGASLSLGSQLTLLPYTYLVLKN